MRAAIAVLLIGPLLGAIEPKPAASDYPVHGAAGNVALGAEYLVRSFSGRGRTFFAPDHLVVEVAVYPPKGEAVAVSTGQFSLRINGKKEMIPAQGPEFVAAGFKYPDWEQRRRLEAMGGVGNAGVIVGRPEPRERFPGDPRPSVNRLPAPPRAPEDRQGVEPDQPVRAEDVVIECALLEREIRSASAGYLYFPFKGKTKSIRSLELVYRGRPGR